jgi:hypothetical protein
MYDFVNRGIRNGIYLVILKEVWYDIIEWSRRIYGGQYRFTKLEISRKHCGVIKDSFLCD